MNLLPKRITSPKLNRFSVLSLFLMFFALGLAGCTSDSKEDEKKAIDPKAGNNLALGVSGNDLLSDEKYSSMVIEVGYQTDAEPPQAALDELKGFLETYTNKPGGISFIKTPISIPGNGPFSTMDAAQIESNMRTQFNKGKKVAVFLLFVDGKSAAAKENQIILGTAYRNTSMIIFQKSIGDLAEETSISESDITANTLKHEFGHLFGLVDNGTPAQSEHMDTNSAHHCNVSGCLMSSTVEFGKSAVEYIKSGENGVFGEKCHQDLISNGGK